MVKWIAIVMLCVATAHGSQVAPRFRVQSSLPSGAMQFEVSDTSATMHVPLWIGAARDAELYRPASGVVATNGDIQTDGGKWYATASGALGPSITGTMASTFHSEFEFNLPSTTSVASWGFNYGSAPIVTMTRLNSDYGQLTFGGSSNLQITQTASNAASVSGTWDFAGLKVGGATIPSTWPLSLANGGTGADLSAASEGLLQVRDDTGVNVIETIPASTYLLAGAKAVDSDKLDGYEYSAFSFSGHNHDATYLGIAATAADSDKLDGVDSTGYSTSGHNHNLAYLGISAKAADSDKLDGLDSSQFVTGNSEPQFANLTLSEIVPVLDILNSSLESSGNFGIQIRDTTLGSYYPEIALGGTIGSYTHALTEEAGTFKLYDAGGAVYSHDGSTHLFSEPVNVSASSTAAFKVGSTPTFLVDTVGSKVGIGTDSPAAKLSVYGSANAGKLNIGYSGNYNVVWMQGDTAFANGNFISSAADKTLYINRPTGSDISIQENMSSVHMTIKATTGNVGVGTNSPGSYKLNVNGSLIATDYYSGDGTQGMTGTVSFTDADSKTNSVTIKDGLITAWSQS